MRACVDIGGTKVAVSLADDDGPGPAALLHRQAEPTVVEGDALALARQVLRLIDRACAAAGIASAQLRSVGVSSCGPFVRVDGQLALAAPNLCGGLAGPARGLPNDWTHAPLEAPLRARLPRVRIENDCVGALEAERRWGALQGLDHCAYVTWSTGIGAAACVDGRVLRGKGGNAGHAGHMFVSDEAAGALCGCGNVDDVEGLVAGNAIARRFGRDAAALMRSAAAGDPEARAAVARLCQVLGRMLYNLVITLDIERVALGGSVFWHHRDWLLPLLQAELTGRLPALTAGVMLVPAGLGDCVGDYAALALAD